MILADLGADVIRVERPGGQALAGRRARPAQPGPAERGARPQEPRGRRDRAQARRGRRRADRGHASGCRRAARLRPRRLPRAQPAAGLRPDDRLGPGRPVGPGGRARHELHRDHRCPARSGPGHEPAALPDQPGRRLRRRLDVPRDRHPRRAPRGAGQRPGPGRRRRDRRRHRAPQHDDRGVPRRGGFKEQRAGNLLDGGVAVLRHLRDLRRQAHERRRARAAVLRRVRRAARHQGHRAGPVRRRPGRRAAQADHRHVPQRTQAEWVEVFEGTDACVRRHHPADRGRRAPAHQGRAARSSTTTASLQPAPAPRFSRTERELGRRPPRAPATTPARRWRPGASTTSTTLERRRGAGRRSQA